MATKTSSKSLVIVESPAKAKTIKRYLGAGFSVQASIGHVKDLPKGRMGVDVKKSFEPEYEVIHGKAKVLADIKKAAKGATVYLASDPDREGEAIAWHIADELRGKAKHIYRVLFNEITKRGITEAMKSPGELDQNKFESQQARRILDRLVGYELSPLLWNRVRRGLSAGRVQSVAVRMIVEREREIMAFVPREYWSVEVGLEGKAPPPFRARVLRRGEEKLEIGDAAGAEVVRADLAGARFLVEKVEQKQRQRRPVAPFVTAKLQQEAARKLGFGAKRTMAAAQRLYEGVEVGEEGSVGLITYMRTDSTRVSEGAQEAARAYVVERWGADYVPEKPNVYKSKKSAQDAHEAIRPTSMDYPPDAVRPFLKRDEMKLYELVWKRFLASQMSPAIYDQQVAEIGAGAYRLRATGQALRFPGWLAAWGVENEVVGETDAPPADDDGYAEGTLPPLEVGEELKLLEVLPEQHFTQPPPRFTEGTLVKEMEERGIGRPSTYASILSTVQDKGYVEKLEGQKLKPTELGLLVTDLLVGSFPEIMDVTFTAGLEEELDEIEEGKVGWVKTLKRFYTPFKASLAKAVREMRDVKREEIKTEHVCEKCGSPMVLKWGRNGRFLACSAYPECKNTKDASVAADGSVAIVALPVVEADPCENCGAPMVVKRGRFGAFLACSRYPECKSTRPISLGIACPREACGGFLSEKRSKRGKLFYGCSNYQKKGCDFVLWDRPVKQACPQCGAPFVVQKGRARMLKCQAAGCGWVGEAPDPEDEGAAVAPA
ncbi:MAG TPA: type I DNA topoisomerase [Myxococcota bacterium]|jgi:DNA topoisomerase-1|nr:type I DNA topoisomerase [Myxococcota bacterium]